MRAWIVLLLRILLAGTFIYAGVLKAGNPTRFAVDIANYHISPWIVSAPLAIYLPLLEIACGLAILTNRLANGALLILLSLLATFIVASVVAKMRGIDIGCGCFGHAGRSLSFAGHLLLDIALLGAAAFLYWQRRTR